MPTLIVIISLLASFATCYFATPTVFGGRDQGAIATAAINLVEYKSFTFSTPVSRDLFEKYGPGKALNYPGFDYTRDGNLTSRFPKAYIAYLAAAYGAFGLKGIQYANFIPLFLFFVLFWLTLRKFFPASVAFLGFLIAATFFPFLWLAKYALTEISMLFLVWAGIYYLISFLKNTEERKYLWLALSGLALSSLVRIEGMAFLLLAVLYLFFLKRNGTVSFSRKQVKAILLALAALFLVYLYLNFPALLDSLKNIAKLFLPQFSKDSRPSSNLYVTLFRLFYTYNFLAYLVAGAAGIAYMLFNLKKYFRKTEFTPFLVLFPSLIYLISPLVSLDDPWIFRRYTFTVFPLLIFYTVWALYKFFLNKKFLYLSLAILIIANAVISWRFITYSENKDLLPQVEKISQKLGPDDLILVDRLATGSGFSLISDPLSSLYGKNAVYFFNADDLKFVDFNRYKNIYLIGPAEESDNWYSKIDKSPFNILITNNNYLEPAEESFKLAVNIDFQGLVGIWKIK